MMIIQWAQLAQAKLVNGGKSCGWFGCSLASGRTPALTEGTGFTSKLSMELETAGVT